VFKRNAAQALAFYSYDEGLRAFAALCLEAMMLGWAVVFALLALVAGFFGFVALAGVSAIIAKVLFLVFLALLIASFVIRALRGDSVV